MKLFKCQACGQVLYFENTRCERCSRQLGYSPKTATLSALEPENELWRTFAKPRRQVRFLRECSARRLQLADGRRQCRNAVRRLPPQSHHPRPLDR